ncbi:MAG: BrnA antitoxin family protein [Casimicrobiaceae bacterium]
MKTEYDFSKAKRGAVVAPAPGKTRITIRLDNELIEWFRGRVNAAGGGNYQSLINDALRAYVNQQGLESTLRKVIREELRRAA